MAFRPYAILALAPAIAELAESVEDVFDGEGNLRADVLDAIGDAYDLAVKVAPKLATIPRSAFLLMVRGMFDTASGIKQIVDATK